MTAARRPFLCWLGRHKWDLRLRRVGEWVPCQRECGAVAHATEHGWEISRES